MKHAILILCMAILFRPALPVLDYIVNYDYIKTELCVNKEKPIMGCNGKCYLASELAKASESDKPASSEKKHTAIEKTDLFFAEIQQETTTGFTFRNLRINSSHTDFYTYTSGDSVFHPPAIFS